MGDERYDGEFISFMRIESVVNIVTTRSSRMEDSGTGFYLARHGKSLRACNVDGTRDAVPQKEGRPLRGARDGGI